MGPLEGQRAGQGRPAKRLRPTGRSDKPSASSRNRDWLAFGEQDAIAQAEAQGVHFVAATSLRGSLTQARPMKGTRRGPKADWAKLLGRCGCEPTPDSHAAHIEFKSIRRKRRYVMQ